MWAIKYEFQLLSVFGQQQAEGFFDEALIIPYFIALKFLDNLEFVSQCNSKFWLPSIRLECSSNNLTEWEWHSFKFLMRNKVSQIKY